MKIYWYGMRLRGFSIGCQPMDGLVLHQEASGKEHYDYLFYNRKLTDAEVEQYELDYFGKVED